MVIVGSLSIHFISCARANSAGVSVISLSVIIPSSRLFARGEVPLCPSFFPNDDSPNR